MAFSFCHVGPRPLATPGSSAQDFEHPAWGNLSSMIGNQYWLPSNAFSNMKSPESFLWQFVASQLPGTIDTRSSQPITSTIPTRSMRFLK
jgi:hypothetical protein